MTSQAKPGNFPLRSLLRSPKLTPDEAVKKVCPRHPLRVKVKLINKITGDETEQDVFLGDLPKMTGRTFIVSGIERAVVNQLSVPRCLLCRFS
jgi:DNA-directed RNA polymerase subunit beta